MQVQDFECLDRNLELGASKAVGLCVQAFEVRRLLGLGVERGGSGHRVQDSGLPGLRPKLGCTVEAFGASGLRSRL